MNRIPTLLLILTLLFSFSYQSFAQSGVQFQKGTWKEILQLAKTEDKIIFMDAYTSWCGPCKKMNKEIFPLKKVGKFYNDNFINVKMDMEKGEGPMLSNKYKVNLYPTLLFIASDGTLVHRVSGYHDENQFLELGAVASNPSKNLAAMEKRFQKGDRDAAFLKNYTKARWETMDGSHQPIAEAYMKTQKNWNTSKNREFIMTFSESPDSELFTFLTENKAAFIGQFGEQKVVEKIQNLVYAKLQSDENITLKDVNMLFAKAYPEKAPQLSSHYRMTYYRNRGDRDGFATSAIDHYAKYKSKDPVELNDVAWTFYEVIEKTDYLKSGIKLAKQSIKLEKGYYNMDTLAALYKKLGKKGKALRTAKKAIKIAKANNEDYSLTEELLTEIRQL